MKFMYKTTQTPIWELLAAIHSMALIYLKNFQ